MCEFCDSYNSNYNSQRVWIEPQPKPILVCDSCRWMFPYAEELVGGLCSACQPKAKAPELPMWVYRQAQIQVAARNPYSAMSIYKFQEVRRGGEGVWWVYFKLRGSGDDVHIDQAIVYDRRTGERRRS